MSAKLVQRVLDWLGKYPPALEKAWDVPRSICLPGIAEGLGVSRSALHAPLSKLLNDGLILKGAPMYLMQVQGEERCII